MVVRLMFGAVGFHRVRTVGEQATRQEAPVLAVAPHSSFYDGLAAVVTGGPTIVAKEENSFIPIVGSTRRSILLFIYYIIVCTFWLCCWINDCMIGTGWHVGSFELRFENKTWLRLDNIRYIWIACYDRHRMSINMLLF